MKRAACAAMLALVASAVALIHAPTPAIACSCVSADPLDTAAAVEVVFTGVPGPNVGTDQRPVWPFTVDGVVKGDVPASVEVDGDDWMSGCGTDFGGTTESIVVYANREDDRLHARGCIPITTRDAFEGLIAGIRMPTGQGPPAAVLSGTVGTSDLAVLDARGRTLAMGSVGNGGVLAHCPGTTTVAIAGSWPDRDVLLVDLTTMTITCSRRVNSDFLYVTGDQVGCFFGGRLVVTSAGFGPNTGAVTVAVSHAAPRSDEDLTRTFTDISRAEIHPAGTVLLLPTTVGESLRLLRAEDLSEVAAVELPPDVSTIDGALSPDGNTLAVLVTASGDEVAYDTGATHVLTLALRDGLPDETPPELIELPVPSGGGRARWIAWLDESTWLIERETDTTKQLQALDVSGAEVLALTDIGWGWGMTATAEGMLRARNGGVELVGRGGAISPGDPAPPAQYVDRFLALAPLVDMPNAEFDIAPIERLTIRAPSTAVVTTTTTVVADVSVPTSSAAGPSVSTTTPGPEATGGDGTIRVGLVSVGLLGALAAVVATMGRRRRARPLQ